MMPAPRRSIAGLVGLIGLTGLIGLIGIAGLAAAALTACGKNSADTAGAPDAGGGSDACSVSLAATQNGLPMIVAGPGRTMRVTSTVTAPGVLHYSWNVLLDDAPAPYIMALGGAAIDVDVSNPGIYRVGLQVTGTSAVCLGYELPVNAPPEGAQSAVAMLRVLSPRDSGIPTVEQVFPILGGAPADLGDIRVDSGMTSFVQVVGPDGPLAAYLQFNQPGLSPMTVEAFSDASGAANVTLALVTYSLTVIPSSTAVAPQRFTPWLSFRPAQLDGGTQIIGSVVGPGSQPLVGAIVRLSNADGVPSTIATTASDGGFVLRASLNGSSTVVVVPAPASGLPRLTAAILLDPDAPLQIRYADNVAVRDLAGTAVRRLGAALPGARLTLTGPLGAVGMASSASRSAVATGDVRVIAAADAGGALPTTRAPAAVMSAVIEPASGDPAVVSLDLRTAAPAAIDAPPAQLVTTVLLDPAGNPLGGAVVTLVPGDALAVAQAPIRQLVASDAGTIGAMVPVGAQYQLRFRDPARRAAPMIVPVQPISNLASSYTLPPAMRLEGRLQLDGRTALGGASVQVICTTCTGADRDLPLDEALSDDAGQFAVTVPDPGTR